MQIFEICRLTKDIFIEYTVITTEIFCTDYDKKYIYSIIIIDFCMTEDCLNCSKGKQKHVKTFDLRLKFEGRKMVYSKTKQEYYRNAESQYRIPTFVCLGHIPFVF